MCDYPRVKVVNEKADCLKTKCYINGREIQRVKAVDFHVSVDEIPTFIFEIAGLHEIEIPADVRFSFIPQTIEDAAIVLRNELLKHGDLYDGFHASIKSALNELGYVKNSKNTEMAEKILKRIIGEA